MKSKTRFKQAGVAVAAGAVMLAPAAWGEVVGYFKLDNFPGDNAVFTDDTGHGLRGLLGYPFSAPGSVAGPSGKPGDLAVSLDGKGALAVDDSAAEVLDILNPPLTLECWARATTDFTGGYPSLISYGVPGGGSRAGRGRGGYKMGVNPSGNILFTLFGVVDVDSGIPYPFDGQWHHVATVYSIEAGGVSFYLDGQEVSFIEETRAIAPPGTRHLDIGAQYTGLGRWAGDIDRVRISTANLGPDDLDADVNTVKPVRNDTAVFFGFDKDAPPYQGQGFEPAGVAISTAEWIIDHPPHENDGDPAKVTDTPSAANGDLALQFGGADVAVVSDPDGIMNVDGDWTLEAWVKVNSAAEGDRDVIFYYGHPGHGYSLSVNYAAGNMLQVTTLGIDDMPSDTAVVEMDVWQHLAVVHKNGESITYYINGQEAGSRAYTKGTRPAETTKALYIGAEWDGALPFTGWIDRVRISNTALTPDQFDSDPAKPAVVSLPVSLAIGRAQSNVTISWPEAGSEGYVLEFSDTLPGSNWSPEATTPAVAGGQKTVSVPIVGVTRFYRLHRP